MAMGTATDPYELRFDSGRSCLDLLATSHPHEHLDAVAPLCAWIRGAGLVPPDTPLTHADVSWPIAFRELRGDIGRLVHGTLVRHNPGRYDADLARLNEAARVAPPVPRAVRDEDGTLVRELDGRPECAALIAAVARDAVELLTDPVAREGLRQCEGDNCPIVYVDTSRGRRRRWCSSEVCGNRERVARHRRRAALARAQLPGIRLL
ncbi:CGNR zinc finger domain-containing protein [Streptomyces sp. NPDC002588]|uniref:CGNR zinc finger domain-containing protein n=1 Tax=Streptomyces sp. NPDC002588 TaxID=3154419 RepID=UPI0033315ECF